jgi:pimeloyl-ACP methyl ester carboxylesterase
MLHGFSADKDNWLRFAKHFTDDFNVVIPDMAGHGDTGFDKSWDYSTPVQATRLVKIIEQLNIERVHVIGHSMGGSIAAHFVKTYPQHTLSATLVAPGGVSSPQPSDMDKMLAQGDNPFEIHSREEFDSFYAMTMQNPPYIPGFILEAVSDKYQQKREQLIQIFADSHAKDLLDSSLDEVTAPILLLWGAEDQLVDVSSVEVWKKEIKPIQVKIWDDIGHMPMLEIPKQSAAVYRDFLGQM